MKLKQKLKQRFVMRCASCNCVLGNTMAGSFSSWFFHEQLCACNNDSPSEKVLLTQATSAANELAPTEGEETIDLGARYEILGLIGTGGMGCVYKAVDKFYNTVVAIKVLNKELIADKVARKRFENEALAVQKLKHPKVVIIKGLGQTSDSIPYIVMEYCQGASLTQLIKTRGHLSVSESVEVTTQVLEAMGHAHANGVIHRDLKPSNILLSSVDGHPAVKVVDFGIAKAISEKQTDLSQLTMTSDIIGSPAYMSPEQCLGEKIDERSDIYSIGCVMYEMLTGKSPFVSDRPLQVLLRHIEAEPEPFEIEFSHLRIPEFLERIVMKCLQKDQTRRYKNAADLAKDLRKFYAYPGITVVGKRLAAGVIDLILLAPIWMIATMAMGVLSVPSYLLPVMAAIAAAVYYACFEFWLQATPGKSALNLRVTDSEGMRDNPVRGAIRVLVMAAVFMMMMFGGAIIRLLMSLNHFGNFDNGSLEIGVAIGLLFVFVACWLPIAFQKDRQSLFDQFFDRKVCNQAIMPPCADKSTKPPNIIQLLAGLIAILIIAGLPMTVDTLQRQVYQQDLMPWPAPELE